jgi:hypothetical protein
MQRTSVAAISREIRRYRDSVAGLEMWFSARGTLAASIGCSIALTPYGRYQERPRTAGPNKPQNAAGCISPCQLHPGCAGRRGASVP